MARMPGAEWKPLPRGFGTRMTRFDLVVVHTCVGSFAGTDSYFRSGQTSSNSHFLTGGTGEIRQLGDTAFRSAANAAGNHRSITIENADMGPGFGPWNTGDGGAVPPFTPQQIEANARICAWAHLTHGVPLVAADTSRPNARGIGYHRLGCNPHRVPDGELWSSAYGKTCPGPRRIAQIPQIIARAIDIVNGDDMPSPEEIAAAVWGYPVAGRDVQAQDRLYGIDALQLPEVRSQAAATIATLNAAIAALADANGGVDTQAILDRIDAKVAEAMDAFRDRVAEGYDVRLEPKTAPS